MKIGLLDSMVFIAFTAVVIAVSVYASRRERNHEDYFLAGRSLKWWVIGISLIASCLSTEQLVGMNGQAHSATAFSSMCLPPDSTSSTACSSPWEW